MNVGSTVRARRRIQRIHSIVPDGSSIAATKDAPAPFVEITQRAVIATIETSNNNNNNATCCKDHTTTTACLIWESLFLQPISTHISFMITPKSASEDISMNMCNDYDGEETEVPVDLLLPLYPFEISCPPLFTDQPMVTSSRVVSNIQLWKDCGDTLFQIHDVVAAIPYYEHALYLSCHCHKYHVGMTIFIKDDKGYIVAADIDCIDTDAQHPSFDITIVETGEERTIRQNDILLSRLLTTQEEAAPASNNSSSSNDIQIRILLNLSRCLLQYVDLVMSGVLDSTNKRNEVKERFCKRVVLATSLALALVKLLQSQEQSRTNVDGIIVDTLSKFETSALLIRSKAQCQCRNKMKHAILDLQKISSRNQEAQILLRQIQRHQKQMVKTNQRLAKNVSQWIQTTLDSTETKGDNNDDDDSNQTGKKVCNSHTHTKDNVGTKSSSSSSMSLQESTITNTTALLYYQLIRLWIPVLFIVILLVTATYIMMFRQHHFKATTETDEAEF